MAKIKKEEYPIKNNGFEYMGNHYDCHYAIERDMKMIIQEAETSHKDNFDEFYDRNTLRPRTMRLYVDAVFGSILWQAASSRSAPYLVASRRTPWQER